MIIIPVPAYGDVLYHNMTTIQPKYFNANKDNIINNVFLKEDYKNKFNDWINHNNKIIKLVKKFYNIIKNKYIQNKLPENIDDLDGETYDKNNKNIYLYEDNKKWWFSIRTMSKLLISNLYYFDLEYLKNFSKNSSNPYTNKKFDYNTYVSIYQQFKMYNSVPDMFLLYKLSNFNLNKFIANNSILINQYICKYTYPNLESETLADIFINITQSYNINYINYNKLYDFAELIRNDIIKILKFINNPENSIFKIKNYIKTIISFHTYLIKKAKKIQRLPILSSNMSIDSDNEDNNEDVDNFDSDNEDNNDSDNEDNNDSDNDSVNNEDNYADNNEDAHNDSENDDKDTINNEDNNYESDKDSYSDNNTVNNEDNNYESDKDSYSDNDTVNNEDNDSVNNNDIIEMDGVIYDLSTVEICNNNN